jgi:hypothetical protein
MKIWVTFHTGEVWTYDHVTTVMEDRSTVQMLDGDRLLVVLDKSTLTHVCLRKDAAHCMRSKP